MGLYNIDFKKINKYNDKNIINHLCKIEETIAKNNGRPMATIVIDETLTSPEYDVDMNQIALPKDVNTLKCIKLITSIIHESEHANQTLSTTRTKNEKMMFDISMALYQDDGIQYSCNYREICARLEEAKCLITLYNDALKQTSILGLDLAGDFKSTIHDTLQFTKSINYINLKILQQWNKNMINKKLYNKDRVRDLSQKDMLHFLKKTAPQMYKNMYNEIKIIRKELQKIYNTLENQYDKNLSKISTELSEMKTNKSQQQRDEVNKMHQKEMIAHISHMPNENHEQFNFDDFDEFQSFVKKTINNKIASIVYVDINWKDEIFKTYIQPQNEKALADEILEENYIPEITTSHDEIDVSK